MCVLEEVLEYVPWRESSRRSGARSRVATVGLTVCRAGANTDIQSPNKSQH